MKTITYLNRGTELQMNHLLDVEQMLTQCITILISILEQKFENITTIMLPSSSFLMLLLVMKSMIHQKEIPGIFLLMQFITYLHQSTSHFLPANIRHLLFATKLLVSLNNIVLQHIYGITQNRI